MKYPQMLVFKLNAEVTTREARESKRPGLIIQAFHQMAFWMLSQFVEHDAVKSVMVTSVYRTQADDAEQLVELQHHIKFSVDGADIGLSEPGAQENLAHEIAPAEYLGRGTITLHRADDIVTNFLAAVEVDSPEAVNGVVNQLASRLVPELGRLVIQHQLNSFA